MYLHLRFTEKDMDLCRWRHSVKKQMLSHYVCQILMAELKKEIAYIPNALSHSADSSPCEFHVKIPTKELERYLFKFPLYKRNASVKSIIRKHLQAQDDSAKSFIITSETFKNERSKSAPESKRRNLCIDEVQQEQPKAVLQNDFVESEEDRAAIMALIAMGGE